MQKIEPFQLFPEYREYVWGGKRLRPNQPLTAEVWAVYEQNLIRNGPYAGQSLAQLSAELGPVLLGEAVAARRGTRFPLLIKLLDCAAWLSLQVHPNDQQARTLAGAGQNGKTEAWHFVEADPGATFLCGLKPGTSSTHAAEAIRSGQLLDQMRTFTPQNGDSILIKAGMVHALGPGLLVYEVQQTSDITYRVYDWGRPAGQNRPLHIEESLQVVNSGITSDLIPNPPWKDGQTTPLLECEYFCLALLGAERHEIHLDPHGRSFQALTMLAGQAQVSGSGWSFSLNQYESLLIPACCQAYKITPRQKFSALIAEAR